MNPVMARHVSLVLLPAVLCGAVGAARAVDHQDPELPDVCSPPIQATISADWRKEALAFRAATLRTFSRYLEGDEPAKGQVRKSLQLAEGTRAHAFDVIELTKELLIRGFRGPLLESLRAMTLDLHASLGAEAAGRFTRVLGAMQGRGSLAESDVQDLTGVLSGDLLRDALGKRLDLHGDQQAVREQVTAHLRDKTIDAALGAGAIVEALLRQLKQGQPGDFAHGALLGCITAMSKACPRKEAEAHCHGTPRDYLDLMRKDL